MAESPGLIVARLLEQLRDDDALLEGLSGAELAAAAPDALARMEGNIQRLRAENERLPLPSRPRVTGQCQEFAQKLLVHRGRLEACQRGHLFEGGASQEERHAARKPKTAEDNAEKEAMAMENTLNSMRQVDNNMGGVNEILMETSDLLKGVDNEYTNYASTLGRASRALGDLKRATEADSKYIWWSFLFFLSVVGFITLKRLKVFKIIYYALSAGAWSGQTVVNIGQSATEELTKVYGKLTESLGFSPAEELTKAYGKVSESLGFSPAEELTKVYSKATESLGFSPAEGLTMVFSKAIESLGFLAEELTKVYSKATESLGVSPAEELTKVYSKVTESLGLSPQQHSEL